MLILVDKISVLNPYLIELQLLLFIVFTTDEPFAALPNEMALSLDEQPTNHKLIARSGKLQEVCGIRLEDGEGNQKGERGQRIRRP
jgi:hypothetical protein